MQDPVNVVEFTRSVSNYRTGERAGFPSATADIYVKAGYANLVSKNVPRIDPKVLLDDAQRKLTALTALLTGAERDARAAQGSPETAPAAAEALRMAHEARVQVEALKEQLAANGSLSSSEERRRPVASDKAA